MKPFLAVLLILLLAGSVSAQEATETPQALDFPLEFPLPHPGDEQLDEAFGCIPQGAESAGEPDPDDESACGLVKQTLALASDRGEDSLPSAQERELVTQIAEQNPALLLDINVIAVYFNAVPLVAAPDFTDQPITSLSLRYTFAGLGDSVDYTVKITHADEDPVITGDIARGSSGFETETPDSSTAVELPNTVDPDVIQAFAPTLTDLVPIGEFFSSVPCWDYYPDWTITLTFADGTVAKMITNNSNVVGIGGPWQIEIDDQHYMQYSGAFSGAVIELLEALDLPLGETAAMGCGGINNPLYDAYPGRLS